MEHHLVLVALLPKSKKIVGSISLLDPQYKTTPLVLLMHGFIHEWILLWGFKRFFRLLDFMEKISIKGKPSSSELSIFCVDPAYQGRGIGKALIRHLREIVKLQSFPFIP